jgi:deoxyribose-phosphate aldolase
MHPNLDFPISFYKDTWSVTAVPAVRGTKLKHTVITGTSFPQGNDIVKVEISSVMVYDATGRLEAYNHRFGNIDQSV